MKLTKKHLRKLIKESIDYGYHYDVLQPLIEKLKNRLFGWYAQDDYEHHIPEPGLKRLLKGFLSNRRFRSLIKFASLETGMRPNEIKNKTIDYLLKSPELTERIIEDYSGSDLHVTHNDEYYSSRVYRF